MERKPAYKIRTAVESDIPAILDLHKGKGADWARDADRHVLLRLIRENGEFQLVAENGEGAIVGAVHVSRRRVSSIDRESLRLGERFDEDFPGHYSKVSGENDRRGNALFAFMVASASPGAGRKLILELKRKAEQAKGVGRLFTFSPLAGMKIGSRDSAATFDQIFDHVTKDGVYKFHHDELGAELVKIIPGGRPNAPGQAAVSFEYRLEKPGFVSSLKKLFRGKVK